MNRSQFLLGANIWANEAIKVEPLVILPLSTVLILCVKNAYFSANFCWILALARTLRALWKYGLHKIKLSSVHYSKSTVHKYYKLYRLTSSDGLRRREERLWYKPWEKRMWLLKKITSHSQINYDSFGNLQKTPNKDSVSMTWSSRNENTRKVLMTVKMTRTFRMCMVPKKARYRMLFSWNCTFQIGRVSEKQTSNWDGSSRFWSNMQQQQYVLRYVFGVNGFVFWKGSQSEDVDIFWKAWFGEKKAENHEVLTGGNSRNSLARRVFWWPEIGRGIEKREWFCVNLMWFDKNTFRETEDCFKVGSTFLSISRDSHNRHMNLLFVDDYQKETERIGSGVWRETCEKSGD